MEFELSLVFQIIVVELCVIDILETLLITGTVLSIIVIPTLSVSFCSYGFV